MAERNELMESYCDFVVKNWNDFETGNYQKTTGRPRVHYQEPLTEEIIAMNVPDLTKDEELLARVDQAIDRHTLIENQKLMASAKHYRQLTQPPQKPLF